MTVYENYQMERRIGKEEGREERNLEIVENMIKKSFSLEEACALIDITVAEYKQYKKKLAENRCRSEKSEE